MITLTIIVLILAIILSVVCGVSILFIDPIIAILVIYLIYRLVKKLFFKE